ncbi:hypothetical protein Cni_G19062 [Canna indica]|uniref:Uncharacterized protein n=1 Tax=Canna indica TaxID=4628 RepID=A0AAQ3KQQ1_9LILI|nr:hypothetical protein Cni_G19062 [Canna indica]
MKSCRGILEALQLYCKITGQKVNVEKSELLFPSKMDKGIKQKICSLFGIKEGKFPMHYLGAYLSLEMLNESYQNKMVERITRRMDLWAGRLISQAGKSVLLNSIVCSFPVYSMMVASIKEKIVKEITKVSREFFWGSEGKKKANLIKWKTVSANKGLGGLGIRDLSLMRKAILAGRILPILNKAGNVWSSLYNAKYDASWKEGVKNGVWLYIGQGQNGDYARKWYAVDLNEIVGLSWCDVCVEVAEGARPGTYAPLTNGNQIA